MRPLIIQVPEGKGEQVVQSAKEVDAKNFSLWSATNGEKKLEVILVFVSNREVEKLIDAVNRIDGVQITLFPQGVMALYPPQNEAPDQVTNVELRSPIEVFLSGLQSIGSWKGFLSYAMLGALIAWIGIFTNTIFLLVGAMLVAPFAGPAMNTAIATARGDARLLRHALLRYGIAILVTVATALLLSILLQQEAATSLMVDRSQVSSTAILLALAAGCAGAINLVQSERSSLVSGAAAGMLVAASLAPPAAVLGMAMAIGEWQMARGTLFLLLLQLVGINLAGSLIFRLSGLKSSGPRYDRGKTQVFFASLAVTVVLLGLLAWWQFRQQPEMQRSSISKRAEEEIQKTVNEYRYAGLVEGNARFTRANIEGQNTLLCEVYVQATSGKARAEIENELALLVVRAIKEELKDVDPVVNIVVMQNRPGVEPSP